MKDVYDIKKQQENLRKHGISFDDIPLFDWNNAITKQDTRYEYGESRFISYGFINNRLHVLIWTLRENNIRPISFRKANQRERRQYEKDKSR